MLTTLLHEEVDSRPKGMPAARARRVVVICDAAPERNGVGAYYADLVEHLADRVEHVELIAPDGPPSVWRGSFPMPGDRTQRIALPPMRSVAKRIAAARPDVVVLPTPGPFGLFGVAAAKRTGARIVVGFHTHYEALSDMYFRRGFGRVSRYYLESSNRLLFRYASAVLVNSEEMRSIATDLQTAPVELVGTPVAKCFLDSPPPAPRHRVRRILFAGRLAPEKNLSAVVETARDFPELEVGIVGDGPLRASLENDASTLPNLELLGWLDRNALRAALDESDLLVLPSHVESFGTVALEALARGRSVVVSHRCGILDWPELAPAIESFGPDETLSDAVRRVCHLTFDERARRAALARRGAERVVADNVTRWMDVLSGHDPDAVRDSGAA